MQRLAHRIWIDGNYFPRKLFKKPRRKIKFKKAYQIIKDYLATQDDPRISAENTAITVNLHIGIVKKVFMRLNREGILSQASHPNERAVSETDWTSDVYMLHGN